MVNRLLNEGGYMPIDSYVARPHFNLRTSVYNTFCFVAGGCAMSSDEMVTISGTFQRSTEKAICVTVNGKDHWFTFSQITSMILRRGEPIDIIVKKLLADEKELS